MISKLFQNNFISYETTA